MRASFIAVLGVLMGVAAPLSAEQAAPHVPSGTTVAFLSSQRILQESADGKTRLAQLQAMQQQKTAELKTRQQTLETTRRDLAAATDPAKRNALTQEEQVQRVDFERASQQAQTDFQALQRQLNTELQVIVKGILDELLKGTDVRMVVNTDTAVVWGTADLDLTPAVIERMNAKAGEKK